MPLLTRFLKIQIIIVFIGTQIAVAQNNNDVINSFNVYLRATHLNTLINAAAFSGPQVVQHFGPQGQITIQNVSVLTLRPDSLFDGPLAFAAAWKNLQVKLGDKQYIYWQLFFKLAEYSGLPPQSLAIMITTDKPRIYSMLIYYKGEIKVDGPASEVKGGSFFKIITDPGKDFANSRYIRNQPYSSTLQKKLVDTIENFLKLSSNGVIDKGAHVDIQNRKESFVVFTATNLHHKITPKFYEVIELYLAIGPVSNGYVNIGYNFELHFGSEPFSVTAYSKNYEDGLRSYLTEMARFNNAIDQLIQNTANAK